MKKVEGRSLFYRCPNCCINLKKRSVEGIPDAIGFTSCNICGASFSYAEVYYEGKYDLPEVEGPCPHCSTPLRGPEAELIGQPCPSCGQVIPKTRFPIQINFKEWRVWRRTEWILTVLLAFPLLMFAVLLISIPVTIFTAPKKNAREAVRFEIRSVETSPVPGTEPEIARLSSETYYIDSNVELNNRHVRKATMRRDPNGVFIDVELTNDGAKYFGEFTQQRAGKQIGILLNGQLWTTALIQTQITGGHLIISGFSDETEAEKIARGIETYE
ncbi:hypothetical protein L0156_28085 [bacterium]|nr:hypothetical protein [bacterium]